MALSSATVVDAVETLSFDSLWLSERITGQAPDPIVAMSYAAGRTSRLKFGMSVLVLPGRNPVVLAKELATLAVMSGGRLLPAFGLGVADGREHQAFGVERTERAAWFDEALAVMRACWRGEPVDHDGDRFHYEGLVVRPVPKRLDVWLGGIAPSELRRVGRLADGWLPSFVTPRDAADGRRVDRVGRRRPRPGDRGRPLRGADPLRRRRPPRNDPRRARRRPAQATAGPERPARAGPRRVGRTADDRHAIRRCRHHQVRARQRGRAANGRRLARPPP